MPKNTPCSRVLSKHFNKLSGQQAELPRPRRRAQSIHLFNLSTDEPAPTPYGAFLPWCSGTAALRLCGNRHNVVGASTMLGDGGGESWMG